MLEQIGLLEHELSKSKSEAEGYRFENESLKSELATLRVRHFFKIWEKHQGKKIGIAKPD